MEIRSVLASDDRRAIGQVYVQSWRHAYRGIVPQDFLDSLSNADWLPATDAPGMRSLILLDGNRIVGTSCFCASRDISMPRWGEVAALYLLPTHMGRGLGRALLDGAVEALHQDGLTSIHLWVLENNLAARRFYSRNGFRPSGRVNTIEIGGKALRELQYILEESFGGSAPSCRMNPIHQKGVS